MDRGDPMSDLDIPVSGFPTFYSTADAVKIRTGVDYQVFSLEDDSALVVELEALLLGLTDIVDRRIRTSYLEEDVIPPGLNDIVADLAAEKVREWVVTRQTPIVRIDDFNVRVANADSLFTPDIEERLALYASGGGMRSIQLETDTIATAGTYSTVIGDPFELGE